MRLAPWRGAEMSLLAVLSTEFQERYSRAPESIARAPGRVNLIGEHTDYNDGFVLPIAVHLETTVLGATRTDGRVRAFSRQFNALAEWSLTAFDSAHQPPWTRYVAGVLALLKRRGAHLQGCDLLIHSTVPVGGGLSSSAALEVAVALAAADLVGEPIESQELIDLCHDAEHEFAGVPCGIMDQSASLLSRAGHALLLDCRTRLITHVPCPKRGHVFVVVDSGQRHSLDEGEYAARREQCAQATQYFAGIHANVRALRDVTFDTVRAHVAEMEPLAALRAMHVTGENERTRAAAEALRAGDLARFGKLMNESHRSLRDYYQVSTPVIEKLVRTIAADSGVLGVRLTGAGFGGCVVAFATEAAVPAIRTRLEAAGLDTSAASLIVVQPGSGAGLVSQDKTLLT